MHRPSVPLVQSVSVEQLPMPPGSWQSPGGADCRQAASLVL
jgi:hypothetical protein